MPRAKGNIGFKGKVEVEVIKKKDVPKFLETQKKETQEKIDFLKDELSKQEKVLERIQTKIDELDQEKVGDS